MIGSKFVLMFPYGIIFCLILSIPLHLLRSCSEDARENKLDELFFLTQDQGYCDAVAEHHLRAPAECQNEAQKVRTAHLAELSIEFDLRPSLPTPEGS